MSFWALGFLQLEYLKPTQNKLKKCCVDFWTTRASDFKQPSCRLWVRNAKEENVQRCKGLLLFDWRLNSSNLKLLECAVSLLQNLPNTYHVQWKPSLPRVRNWTVYVVVANIQVKLSSCQVFSNRSIIPLSSRPVPMMIGTPTSPEAECYAMCGRAAVLINLPWFCFFSSLLWQLHSLLRYSFHY